MVHQSVSEHLWFSTMLGISVTDNPLPGTETRQAFMRHYADNANRRLTALREHDDAWWETIVPFFEVTRSRAWIMTRRIAHTAASRWRCCGCATATFIATTVPPPTRAA